MRQLTAESEVAGLRPRILCVDDEPLVLEGLRATLRRSFDVSVATSGPDALTILKNDPDGYAIVISDMHMPVMSGASFLRECRRIAPDAVCILLTGNADVHSAIKVVNDAHLFRFLTKPCDAADLMRACAAALGHHKLRTAERGMLKETAERVVLEQTLRGSVETLAEILALSSPAAFGRGNRIKRLAGGLARVLALPNAWEVEVAAMLAHIGAVTLPQATAERVYAGSELTEQETAMVDRVPAATRRLLSRIPRLEGVLAILQRSQAPAHDGDTPDDLDAQVLRIAADYDALESQGTSPAVALEALGSRRTYDPTLIDALALAVVDVGGQTPSLHEVTLDQLAVGMILADDVRADDGTLLVARGQHVSDELIERLTNLSAQRVREPIRVLHSPPPA